MPDQGICTDNEGVGVLIRYGMSSTSHRRLPITRATANSRAQVGTGELATVETVTNFILDTLLDLGAGASTNGSACFSELGLDSLELLQVRDRLVGHFGLSPDDLPASFSWEFPSPRELAEAVWQRMSCSTCLPHG